MVKPAMLIFSFSNKEYSWSEQLSNNFHLELIKLVYIWLHFKLITKSFYIQDGREKILRYSIPFYVHIILI